MRIFYLLLLISYFLPLKAFAEDITPEISFAQDDNYIFALTSFDIPAGYHAYTHESKGAGMPTSLSFSINDISGISTFYPPGQMPEKTVSGGIEIPIYSGNTEILSVLPKDSAGRAYSVKLNLLLCSDKRCVPIKKILTGEIPKISQPLNQSGWNLEKFSIDIHSSQAFIAQENNNSLPDKIPDNPDSATGTGILLEPTGKPERVMPLEAPEDFDLMLKPVYFSDTLEVFSLFEAIFFGLTAGLLLNAMPCVLPVLGLKVNALLGSGNRNNKKALKAFRRHNIWFIAGVMTFFSCLALLLGAADLLWGQLFQSQTLVLIILMLVFLMGLSMFGVFTLPILNLKIGENSKNPAIQAFSSGLLCTFLATPCSGPLLGGVLAWAFNQSLLSLLAVFWAVGLGMCLPYIAFCIWPEFGRILPKPGNWMHIFETILGFLLLGTALYLLSILPQNKHMHILCSLIGIAFSAWLLGKFCNLFSPLWKKVTGSLFGIAVIVFSIIYIMQPPGPAVDWENFDARLFTESHGKKNMLLEFTADWCINCKYLETTVLTEEFLTDLQNKYDLELIKVDITTPNPYAERLLTQLGSRSIPVTALFPKGDKASAPLILRDLYGKDALKKATTRIF